MSVVANVAINVDSRNAVSKLREVQSQSLATERALQGISKAAAGLQTALAGAGIAGIVLQTTRAAASFNDLQTRLKLLTSEYGEYAQAQRFAAQSAKTFGLSTREATAGVADIFARLRPLGVSLKDIQSTFTGFNTIAKLSGVSAEGAAAAFTQLAQALGSGRLQGDEFRSIGEQIPGLLVAVSKETGVAASDLKQFAADGKLTADIVISALRRIESEGAGKIAQLVQESDVQKFKDFQNAVDDLSVAIGNELLPVVTPLIQDTTNLLKAIAGLPQPVKSATTEIIKLVVQIVLLDKAIKAIIGLRAAFVAAMGGMTTATVASATAAKTGAGAFALYANNTRVMQAQAAAATPVMNGLLLTLRNLAAIGTIAILVNVAVTGMAAVYQAQAEIDRLRGVRSKGGAAGAFGGSATAEQKKAQQAALAAIQKERQSAGFRNQQAAAAAGIGKTMARQRADQLAERERFARSVLALPTRGAAAPIANAMGTPVGASVGGGGGGRASGGGVAANDAKRAAEQAAQAEQQMQERLRALTRESELTRQIATIKELQFTAEMDGNKELQIRLQGEEKIIQIMQATAQALDGITDERLRQATLSKAEAEIDSARQETMLEMQRLESDRTKAYEQIIADLDLELALKTATTEQAREQLRLEAEIAKIRGDKSLTPEQQDEIERRKRELAKPKGESQKIEERLDKVKDELKELTSLSYQVTQAAEAIGNAFSQAFTGLVSGSMTAKEALASFFKSVGDHFMDMASKMIAKMVEMFILQTVLGIIGGAAGGGNYSSAFKSAPKTSFGGALAMPKLMAEGGFVTGPTSAIIGEGGEAEYVIPASKMQSAMARYSRGARGEAVIPATGGSEGGMEGAAAGTATIDVRYSVERINNVEYVTADQFRQGLQQAASEGASRGEQATLRRLQQSRSTRSRLGLS